MIPSSQPAIRQLGIGLVGLVIALAPAAKSCNTPIYRYALEHWMPQPYECVIFRRGKSPDRENAVKLIETLSNAHANLFVTDIDVDKPIPQEVETIWAACRDKQLPWLAVRFPQNIATSRLVCSVALSAEAVKRLLHSPTRQDLAKHLSGGDAAVWLFVDGGRKGLDDAKAAQLEKMAAKLSEEFTAEAKAAGAEDGPPELPAGIEPVSAAPDKVTFSFIRLRRNDTDEAMLLNMLFERDAELAKRADSGACAFLVFGRGRMLGPLTGDELREESIASAAEFLSGPCMCEIKEQNPGMDLLIDADWEEMLAAPMAASARPGPAPADTSSKGQPAPAPVVPLQGKTEQGHPAPGSNDSLGFFFLLFRNGYTLAGILIGIGALSILMWLKGGRGPA